MYSMPYRIQPEGKGYVVVTDSGPNKGHKHSNHPLSKMMAEKQMKALYYSMKNKPMK
jgi:hypothetical protein